MNKTNEWKDISTAPKDGRWILLYDPQSSKLVNSGCWDEKFEIKYDEQLDEQKYVGAWTDYGVESFSYEEYSTLNPTHWMPHPKPPKEPTNNL